MTTSIYILIISLCLAGSILTLFGLFMFIKIFVVPNKAPADVSNRINRIRLVWFAMQSPELFVDLFPWIKNDEYENVKDIKK